MIDYDKVATAADPQGAPDLAKRFEDALRALEKRAKEGGYTREEFGELRGLLAKRGREAAKSEAQGTSAQGTSALAATPLERSRPRPPSTSRRGCNARSTTSRRRLSRAVRRARTSSACATRTPRARRSRCKAPIRR
jgi:hypothetical protein